MIMKQEKKIASCCMQRVKRQEKVEGRLEKGGGGGSRRNSLYGQMNCKKEAHARVTRTSMPGLDQLKFMQNDRLSYDIA